MCVLSFVLKMSTRKRKRNLLDFRQKREIVEIKNPTTNETWEAARHWYIGKWCPPVTSTFWTLMKKEVQAFLLMGYNPREHAVNYLIVNACVKTTEKFICELILTTSSYRNQFNFQTIHWQWHASKCCINIFQLKYNTLASINIFDHLSLNN